MWTQTHKQVLVDGYRYKVSKFPLSNLFLWVYKILSIVVFGAILVLLHMSQSIHLEETHFNVSVSVLNGANK